MAPNGRDSGKGGSLLLVVALFVRPGLERRRLLLLLLLLLLFVLLVLLVLLYRCVVVVAVVVVIAGWMSFSFSCPLLLLLVLLLSFIIRLTAFMNDVAQWRGHPGALKSCQRMV